MDSERALNRLLNVARQTPVGDGVPYAFEKRIMAHIRESGVADPLFFWVRALWRSVPVFAVVCTIAFVITSAQPPASDVTLQASFEDVVMTSGDFFSDSW